jgi:predicted DNA-binding transcriptional regulator YafY
MFSGELVQATLEFDRQLVNNVLDRFGGEVIMQPHGDRLRIHVNVSNNPVFLSWMIQFGELAAIIAPQSLKEALLDLMVRHRANYAE